MHFSYYAEFDRITDSLVKEKKFTTKRGLLLLAASTCSLIAAGAAVCGLFANINGRTHTTTTSTTPSITTTTTTTTTTGLRQPPGQPAVTGYEATATVVETALGGEADGGGHQALSAGYTFLPVILRRQDHKKIPTAAEIAVERGREEAAATLQRVNASDRTQTPGDQGARGGWRPPLASQSLVDDQPYHNTAEATATTTMGAATTRRATVAQGGGPGGLSEPEPKGPASKTPVALDVEAISDVGEGDGICSPLEVVGLSDCPQLNPDGDGSDLGSNAVIKKMLDTKADMLRQVIEVLTDPASAGQGGNPDEPLLLVQKLAVDETDAVFNAFGKEFLGHAVDASSWNPLPGGFNRWVELYYRTVLRETRPVLITVHGDDVCALEKELSLEARLQAADVNGGGIDGTREGARMASRDHGGSKIGTPNPSLHFGEGREDFEVPVVLMTLGWDPEGDPTHEEVDRGRDRACAFRVLEMNRVVRWFTSHTRFDSHADEKFTYIPLGFGGYDTRNGLPHTAYIDAAKHRLKVLETCPVGETGRYDLLLQCNTLDRPIREVIWKRMTEGKERGAPIPVNRAPLEPADMVTATTKGIFTVSPPGTGPDCFRHYEVMLEGNIALVPDTSSMKSFMGGLPVFFFGDRQKPWGSLTCRQLMEMSEKIQATIKEGKENNGGRLQFEKLTHGFWRAYIRREVLRAGGVGDDSATATYVERSVAPLNPQGWTTFRRIGCFTRAEEREPQDQSHHRLQHLSMDKSEHVALKNADRTPEGCAAHCSVEAGGGVGFFGIGSGDECWCDVVPGNVLPMDKCDLDCDGDYGGGRCGGDYASSVYVFGPEEGGAAFEYMGCFPSTKHFMFHAAVHLGDASTPFMCEAFCTSMRYPFFALENSDLCRCGVIPANTPRSDRVPAYIEGGGYEPIPGPPNAKLAAKPSPEGVHVGDPRFSCHKGRCGGNSETWGCGAERVYDLYRHTEPCMLYQDCQQ